MKQILFLIAMINFININAQFGFNHKVLPTCDRDLFTNYDGYYENLYTVDFYVLDELENCFFEEKLSIEIENKFPNKKYSTHTKKIYNYEFGEIDHNNSNEIRLEYDSLERLIMSNGYNCDKTYYKYSDNQISVERYNKHNKGFEVIETNHSLQEKSENTFETADQKFIYKFNSNGEMSEIISIDRETGEKTSMVKLTWEDYKCIIIFYETGKTYPDVKFELTFNNRGVILKQEGFNYNFLYKKFEMKYQKTNGLNFEDLPHSTIVKLYNNNTKKMTPVEYHEYIYFP